MKTRISVPTDAFQPNQSHTDQAIEAYKHWLAEGGDEPVGEVTAILYSHVVGQTMTFDVSSDVRSKSKTKTPGAVDAGPSNANQGGSVSG